MKKDWGSIKKKLYEHSDLLIVLFLGIFLRLKDIVRDDFWYDEAFSGLMTKIPLEEFLEILKKDPHPPLFAFLTRGWAILMGTSDLSLRLFPALFGILTLVILFLTVKELFGKKAGIITTLLASINPFLISYSQEMRSYSLFAFLVLLSFYFCVKERKWAFTISAILMINVHFMGILFLPGLFISYIFFNHSQKNEGLNLRILKKLSFLIPIIIAALYLISESLGRKEVLNIDWARNSSFWLIPRSFVAYLFGIKSKNMGIDNLIDYKLPINILYVGYIVFLIFIVELFYQIRKAKFGEKVLNLIILANLLIPQIFLIGYGIYKGENLYVERYLIPCSLFLLIALGVMLTERVKFESAAIILVLYLAILSRQILPDYYRGMKFLAKDFRYVSNNIVFTKPADFIIAKYYMYEMQDHVLLYDPEFPDWDYAWWPFISTGSKWNPTSQVDIKKSSIFVIPEKGFIPPAFKLISNNEYGDYGLYYPTN